MGRKKYVVLKSDLADFIKEITEAMAEAKQFYNVVVADNKDPNKATVIIG